MKQSLARQLDAWFAEGRKYLGEVRIERDLPGFRLCHYLDHGRSGLAQYHDPEDAINLGKFDSAGKYRPLRSAPTLQQGWQLNLSTIDDLVQALEYFYPAMLGTAQAFEQGLGKPANLRESLDRQSGMYRVTQKISNADADEVIARVCPPEKCLKTITWKIDHEYPIQSLPTVKVDFSDPIKRDGQFIPLPCEESCNILIAAIRESVKKAAPLSVSEPS